MTGLFENTAIFCTGTRTYIRDTVFSTRARTAALVHVRSCRTRVLSLRRNPTGPYAVREYTLCGTQRMHSALLYAGTRPKYTMRVYIVCWSCCLLRFKDLQLRMVGEEGERRESEFLKIRKLVSIITLEGKNSR